MEKLIATTKRTLIEVVEALGIRNLDGEPGQIFVTGGSGLVGHRVAALLLKSGCTSVRVGARKSANVQDLCELGAEVADFGWEREETYAKALVGVKSVLCTIPYTKQWCKHFLAFVEACNMAGVKHLIKLSIIHATVNDNFQDVPLIRGHGDCDEALVKFINPKNPITTPIMGADADFVGIGSEILRPNMSYTILYATHLMSNPFYFQGHDLRCDDVDKPASYYGASGNHGINYVSPNDVAEVAMRVLLAPKEHYNKEYTLTGPTAIQDQQVADMLSRYLRKPVVYVDQPLLEFGRNIKRNESARWMMTDLVALEKLKASGVEEGAGFVSPDVEAICGHPPQSFEEYLREPDKMTAIETGKK